jgi:hypothetical protein
MGVFLVAGLSAHVAIILRVLRTAASVPGQLATPLFKLLGMA